MRGGKDAIRCNRTVSRGGYGTVGAGLKSAPTKRYERLASWNARAEIFFTKTGIETEIGTGIGDSAGRRSLSPFSV
jgi:hypothetical protein